MFPQRGRGAEIGKTQRLGVFAGESGKSIVSSLHFSLVVRAWISRVIPCLRMSPNY